jgi:hypothetical protein
MTAHHIVDLVASLFFIASGILWFRSAAVKLTNIGFGQDELDKVTKLAADLQRMGRWNYWAAGATGIAVFLQAVLLRFV